MYKDLVKSVECFWESGSWLVGWLLSKREASEEAQAKQDMHPSQACPSFNINDGTWHRIFRSASPH